MEGFKVSVLSKIRADYAERRPEKRKESFLYQYFLKEKKETIRQKQRETGKPEEAVIHKLATDFMYNLGFSLSGRISGAQGKRSSNTALDLVSAWCDRSGISGDPESGALSSGSETGEFDPEPYQLLYEILNREKCTGAFIPVRVDPLTGKGFFIVGKDHFRPDERHGRACEIAAVTVWDSGGRREEDDEDFLELNLSYGVEVSGMDVVPKTYPNIAEANAWFVRFVFSDNGERFDFFRECNGSMPEGVPEQFALYFENEEEAGSWSLTEDDLRMASEEFEK